MSVSTNQRPSAPRPRFVVRVPTYPWRTLHDRQLIREHLSFVLDVEHPKTEGRTKRDLR